MSHIVDVKLTRCIQYLLLVCVFEADLSTAQTISKLGPKKRGGGWGYTAQDVGGELQAMPVRWWYNWGNGIPDSAAQAVTAVRSSLGVAVEKAEVLLSVGPVSKRLFLSTGKRDRLRSHDIWQLLRL